MPKRKKSKNGKEKKKQKKKEEMEWAIAHELFILGFIRHNIQAWISVNLLHL